MFVRVLFLLLLALNIGVGAWLVLTPAPVSADPPATDPGVPALVLLAERERGEAASTAELATAPPSDAEIRRERCVSLGPFPTQADMRRAMNRLTPLVERIQFREVRATQPRGYWVFLPALPTREQALAIARQLSSKGVRDYYVVTAGDQQNTISLGLFRDQSNAERRRAEIAAQGFKPELVQRSEELPVYWIDYAADPERPVEWRSLLHASDLHEQAATCF